MNTVHTPTLENTTIQEGTESEIGIQKNVLKTCAFFPRLIKHPWFWEAVKISMVPRTEPWGTPQM